MSTVTGIVSPLFLAVIIMFLLLTIGIGIFGYLTTNTESDFIVAGRSIGPVVGGSTLAATQMSAGTFVGTIGVHYLTGVSFIYIWVPIWLGWFVSLIFIAPKMRRFGELTVPDFLVARFGRGGRSDDYLRALSAVLIFGSYLIYISAQYTGASLIIESLFGVSSNAGIIAMTIIVLIYTTIGGMRASALTDFVQFVVMITAAVIVIPQLFLYIGGLNQIDIILHSLQPSFTGWDYTPLQVATIGGATGFSILGAPYELTRVFSMRDEKTVRQSIGLMIIYQVIIGLALALIGMGMRVMYPQLSVADLAGIIMGINVIGSVLGALLIAAILGAILSTVDSIMIVSASALAHDIYGNLINRDATEKQKLRANRIATAITGIIPLFLAITPGVLGGLVQFIVLLQAALIGAAFSMPVLLGLRWKRANFWGAVLGMISGFIAVLIWNFLQDGFVGVLGEINPIIPGVVVSLIGLLIGSYLTSPPDDEKIERFFET